MDNPERPKGGMFGFIRRDRGTPVADAPIENATPTPAPNQRIKDAVIEALKSSDFGDTTATAIATTTKDVPPITPGLDQTLTKILEDTTIKDSDSRRIGDKPRKEKRRLPLKVRLGLAGAGLLALAGGIGVGINKIRGDDESTPQVASQSQSIDSSVPTSFNNQEVQAEQKPGNYFGFKELPPGRDITEEKSPQSSTPELPAMTEYNSVAKFIPEVEVLKFRLQERPPSEKEVKVFTHGLDNPPELVKTPERFPPFFQIYGYLIGKELNSDGSVILTVEVPGKKAVFSPDDIDKSMTEINNLKDNGNEGEISGVVIKLSLQNTGESIRPLAFYADWRNDFFSSDRVMSNSARATSNPEELYKVIRIGDPLTAGGVTGVSREETKQLEKIHQQYQSNIPLEEALSIYSKNAANNASAIQRIIEDSKRGDVSLREQINNEQYTLTPNNITFVPRKQ